MSQSRTRSSSAARCRCGCCCSPAAAWSACSSSRSPSPARSSSGGALHRVAHPAARLWKRPPASRAATTARSSSIQSQFRRLPDVARPALRNRDRRGPRHEHRSPPTSTCTPTPARRTSTRACTSISTTARRAVGAFARIGNRPNERYAEMTIAVYQPDGTALFNYKRPEIADNSAFAAGGMRFDVVEPFKHLRVAYDGQAVYLAQPLRSRGSARRAFTGNPLKPVSLELDWYGLSPMYGGDAARAQRDGVREGPLRTARPRASARLTVDGTTHAVDGFGLRDHSWGPRSWQSPAYYRWLIGQFDDGFGFMGSQIVTQSGSELLSGFVFQRRREPLRRPARRCTPTGPTRPLSRSHRPDPAHARRRRRDQRHACSRCCRCATAATAR